MPIIAAAGAAVTIALTSAGATATVGAIAGSMVSGAITGSLIGGGVAIVTGGDIGKGMLLGAAAGAISGGIVSGGNMIASAASGGNVGASAATQVAEAGATVAGNPPPGLLSNPTGYIEGTAPGQMGIDAGTQLAGTVGGQAAMNPLDEEAEAKPQPGTTGNVYADYLNRTPGAIDAYLAAKEVNPGWTAEEWARKHYEAASKEDSTLYWGLTKDADGGLLDTGAEIDPDVLYMDETPGAWDAFYDVRKINPKWTLAGWVRGNKKARGLEVEPIQWNTPVFSEDDR